MANIHYVTTTDLGANLLTDVYLEKRFISRLLDKLLAVKLGKESTLPENMGKTVRWQYSSQPTVLSSVTDGADPSDRNFTTTTVTATLAEYKAETTATKQLLTVGLSAWLEEVIDASAYQMAATFDTLCLAQLDATSTTVDAGTAMTADATRQGVAKLMIVNAEPHPLSPGGAYFYGLYGAESAMDMAGEGAPAWFQVMRSEYQNTLRQPFGQDQASANIYGAMIKVSNAVRQQTNEEYNVLVGKEALGVASLATNVLQPRVIVTRPEERVDRSTRDRGAVGTWALFTAARLDSNRVAMVKADVS